MSRAACAKQKLERDSGGVNPGRYIVERDEELPEMSARLRHKLLLQLPPVILLVNFVDFLDLLIAPRHQDLDQRLSKINRLGSNKQTNKLFLF